MIRICRREGEGNDRGCIKRVRGLLGGSTKGTLVVSGVFPGLDERVVANSGWVGRC